MPISPSFAYRAAVCSLFALIFLSLAWELWLAPLRPGGSWLALKALPLCLLLPGVLRRNRQTFLLGGMLVLFYVAEAVVQRRLWPRLCCFLYRRWVFCAQANGSRHDVGTV